MPMPLRRWRVTAIETALQGRFRLTVRKDLRFDYPRAETPDHYMTMAMDPDLDQCVVRALRDMIVLLGEKRNLSREDAYTLCSLAADLRVTQTVNGSKGIHCMIEKTVVHRPVLALLSRAASGMRRNQAPSFLVPRKVAVGEANFAGVQIL